MQSRSFRRVAALCSLALLGCSAAPGDDPSGEDAASDESPFSSNQATLLRFEFDAEFVTSSTWSLERTAQDQLLYTIGHLNANDAVGRIDNLVLSNFKTTSLGNGLSRVTYHAVLPVGWGSKTNLPASYELTLPKRVDFSGLEAFTSKYKSSCVDFGAHDVTSGSMWYYYRPKASGCALAADDVVKATATVTVSPLNTSGKYPEYHRVWEDDELRVVAIFGKDKETATSNSDVGINAYNRFVGKVETGLGVTLSPDVPVNPGVGLPDIELSGTMADGRKLRVNALLVNKVSAAGPDFDARYNALSTQADVIFYNGHAGLGQNVKALAKKGKFAPGKYQIFFMNGCDTFAYVDGSLAQTRALINPDDPTGTKYMDMITNAMPAFFHSLPSTSMAIIEGLLSVEHPMTYDEMFAEIDLAQVVVVTGEEDNVYTPGGVDPDEWPGMSEEGSVANGASLHYETPELPAGKYVFETSDQPGQPSGDVDVYVRVGAAPTLSNWDFRPYKDGSAEKVTVTLSAPSKVFLMVHGYEQSPANPSSFQLSGAKVD